MGVRGGRRRERITNLPGGALGAVRLLTSTHLWYDAAATGAPDGLVRLDEGVGGDRKGR